MFNYIHRHLEEVLKDERYAKGVVAVTGARQTGKSTLLDHFLPNIPHLTLDDLRLRAQALSDPALFVEDNQAPVFIDEAQLAPEIFPFIKIKVDKARQKNMYYLSGSQKFNMMENMTESLAGRVAVFELLGLSMREIQGDKFRLPFIPSREYLDARKKTAKPADIWELIYKGSMPQMYSDDLAWKKFYSDYVNTYLERDVSKLAQVGDALKFTRFMEALAARTANILNLNDFCKDVGISHPTAEKWLSVLVKSNIVYLLKPYYNNLTKRAVKTPKLYFLDTGLAAYLTHWDTKEVLKNGAKAGDFLENFIVCEALKSYCNSGVLPNNLYYYRDKEKREIDLIVEIGGTLYPVEIKSHSNPTPADIKSFDVLSKLANVGEGAVVCPCDTVMSLSRTVRRVPVWYI